MVTTVPESPDEILDQDNFQQEPDIEQCPSTTPPVVVLRSAPGRTTWTKRLSKSIQRRSGSFLNTFVPFRKGSDHSNRPNSPVSDEKSPETPQVQHKRRASAAPALTMSVTSRDAASQSARPKSAKLPPHPNHLKSPKQQENTTVSLFFCLNGLIVFYF